MRWTSEAALFAAWLPVLALCAGLGACSDPEGKCAPGQVRIDGVCTGEDACPAGTQGCSCAAHSREVPGGCNQGLVCRANVCVEGETAACERDTDCFGGDACVEGVCVDRGQDDPDAGDGECSLTCAPRPPSCDGDTAQRDTGAGRQTADCNCDYSLVQTREPCGDHAVCDAGSCSDRDSVRLNIGSSATAVHACELIVEDSEVHYASAGRSAIAATRFAGTVEGRDRRRGARLALAFTTRQDPMASTAPVRLLLQPGAAPESLRIQRATCFGPDGAALVPTPSLTLSR